ncbi:MAG: sensor histidine kinase [Rhodospirillaceae bacterium]
MKKPLFNVGVTAALTILVAIGLAAFINMRDAEESSRRIVHSSRFVAELEELLSQLKDAESGQRGYVITGNPAFLEPYESATRALPGLIKSLTEMAAGNESHRDRVIALGELVSQRYVLLRTAIKLRRDGEAPEAIGRVVGGPGKRIMDDARSLVASMKKDEEAQLEHWTRHWESTSRTTVATMAGGSTLAMAFLLVALVVVRRELHAREAAQKKAEDYGREVEDLYNHAPCAYHSLDAQGRIVRANDTELAWLGYERDELIGKPFASLLTETGRRQFDERFECLKNEGSVHDAEFDLRRKDGSTFPVSLSATAVRDESGRFVMSRVTMFDITARRSAESRAKQLNVELERRNTQLVAVNQELEGFSYSVSHDLRVPLRAIDGYARMLQEDIDDKLDAEDRRKITVVRDSARKMGQLIDDLLSFSRLGRKPLNMALLDMTRLVREAYHLMQQGAERPLPELRMAELPAAWGDKALLRQVWINLLSNAVKFTAGRGQPQIEVGGCRTVEGCLYWVRDNGAGFDMKYADKLFGVFQRLHSQQEYPGTGVGLAIVKRAVTRHAGRVRAEGAVGEGATFYFSLPDGGNDE